MSQWPDLRTTTPSIFFATSRPCSIRNSAEAFSPVRTSIGIGRGFFASLAKSVASCARTRENTRSRYACLRAGHRLWRKSDDRVLTLSVWRQRQNHSRNARNRSALGHAPARVAFCRRNGNATGPASTTHHASPRCLARKHNLRRCFTLKVRFGRAGSEA